MQSHRPLGIEYNAGRAGKGGKQQALQDGVGTSTAGGPADRSLRLLAAAAGSACLRFRRHGAARDRDVAGLLREALWRVFYHLYELSRTQFGFSPLDSLRIALSAASAAKAFQPTRSRGEAAAALRSSPPITRC
jgi:hypothetical protein